MGNKKQFLRVILDIIAKYLSVSQVQSILNVNDIILLNWECSCTGIPSMIYQMRLTLVLPRGVVTTP